MLQPGTKAKCLYRGDHVGVVLSADDPRAWKGSVAFPGTPRRADVRAHLEWCRSHASFDPDNTAQPVLWPWGVMWDRQLIAQEAK